METGKTLKNFIVPTYVTIKFIKYTNLYNILTYNNQCIWGTNYKSHSFYK